MFLSNMLVAAAIALVLVLIASMITGRRPVGMALIAFFLIVLMAAWAGSVWITAGPAVMGVYFLPGIVIAGIFAFVIAVAMPTSHPARVSPDDMRDIGRPGGGYATAYNADVIARAARLDIDDSAIQADLMTSADEGVQAQAGAAPMLLLWAVLTVLTVAVIAAYVL
jgi:hypothetical protein